MKLTKKEQKQWYRDNKGQKINQENYDYSDTKKTQIRSVLEFMDALNYDYCPAFKSTFCARYGSGFKGCEVISFNTAVKLHDSVWNKARDGFVFVPEISKIGKLGGWYYERTFEIDAYTLTKAQACKIVERAYVHCTKSGLLRAYKNQLKFTNIYYEQQFLKPILDEEAQ